MTASLTAEDLESLARQHSGVAATRSEYSRIATRMPKIRGAVREWFIGALADDEKKWFAAGLLDVHPDSCRGLERDLLRAAMVEENPSLNKAFVRPLRTVLSGGEALRILMELADSDSSLVGGAARAAYWSPYLKRSNDRSAYVDFNSWRLRRFVEEHDAFTLRSLLAGLSFAEGDLSADALPLRGAAISKARSHQDEYVGHRITIQLGESAGPYLPLINERPDPKTVFERLAKRIRQWIRAV